LIRRGYFKGTATVTANERIEPIAETPFTGGFLRPFCASPAPACEIPRIIQLSQYVAELSKRTEGRGDEPAMNAGITVGGSPVALSSSAGQKREP